MSIAYIRLSRVLLKTRKNTHLAPLETARHQGTLYIKVFDHTVLEALGKVQARIEELRQAKGDRQQLELKFGDVIVAESPTGVSFPPLAPVRLPLGHQNIADSVVSC
jgi:hypothetical protein